MTQNNDIVLVIPAILEIQNGDIRIDRDFANNLAAYLASFDRVEVFCPAAERLGSFPALVDPWTISGSERLSLHVLPQPYREDRYLRHRRRVKAQLTSALVKARYRLISPHAPLNWSSLAGSICVARHLPFDFEADWDLAATSRFIIRQMPFGIRKLHHWIRLELHLVGYRRLLRKSTLTLVQGQDVFEAYKDLAPNVHSVLNVQITDEDRVSPSAVAAKVADIKAGLPLEIAYAGRASEMKGPMLWLETLRSLRDRGVQFRSVWLGEGELLERMRAYVAAHSLETCCSLPGGADKEEVLRQMRAAHLFVFCHMGYESPRNLMEAVASGAPLCGFGTPYSESLVGPHGGGVFVSRGDTNALAQTIKSLDQDRTKLAALVQACAESGTELDRDKAISRRIDLLRKYL